MSPEKRVLDTSTNTVRVFTKTFGELMAEEKAYREQLWKAQNSKQGGVSH